MESENRKTILFAFAANLLIAVAKLVGGVASGSIALLAEAAHSVADCLNQIFLLVSLSLGRRRPDETHPFGHGKERFFWALMAAVMIFVGGAIFSIAQGLSGLRSGRRRARPSRGLHRAGRGARRRERRARTGAPPDDASGATHRESRSSRTCARAGTRR